MLTQDGVIYGGKSIDQIGVNILPLKLQKVFRAYLRATHSGCVLILGH